METKNQVIEMLDFLDAREVQQVLADFRNFYPPMNSDLKELEFKSKKL